MDSSGKTTYFPFGLQISRKEWQRYNLTELLKKAKRNKDQAETFVFRMLSDRVNEEYRISQTGETPVYAGQLMVLGLINEIFRYVINIYCTDESPGLLEKGIDIVREKGGSIAVDKPIEGFIHLFPPQSVELAQQTESDFLQKVASNIEDRFEVLSEMALLFLANGNPAFKPFQGLFDDSDYQQQTKYLYLITNLEAFFNEQPSFDDLEKPLFKVLRSPIIASPYSLDGQLEYIIEHWSHFLPEHLRRRLLLVRDIFREETAQRGFGPGPARIMKFGKHPEFDSDDYLEPERFSHDADWMSNVVLIAKSVYVWLDQLSKKYRRSITKLDQIPDEELDRLAGWGFTGLWLIGVWERSPASQKIKQIMGNPEAASSAYSLYDYTISSDLGGESAYENLRDRARSRGIRLSSDMVPNHMGIYSKWLIEHPDWFINQDYSPFPNYNFSGENLSWDDRVSIYIENGYWNHSDAAVVFKRVDNWTGSVKYIYHGNDGTHMPWNDTAQLNYLLPEVREAVIQMILHVARKFSIIRFDAAMTLAKRHFQRLWFPKPGEGGAIPSRAEHGITKEEFKNHMPEEFWREVVDRVAREVPDTLLLAEAFWLMEGYFVRTLGMHRVYNSAFMNMLKMEENANYRTTIKNVLEFSPEVLKRFVNFMNNPDEKTAVEQFGKGDKYFGVAVLLVTMPGLPMFGHGQIEGFTEKYGMEYQRAYWDEPVDEDLVRRHVVEIFPLMRKRYLFSGVADFALFDFRTPEGFVDENVFAYSNRIGNERAVVIYNNAYSTTRGRIHTSTSINIGKPDEPNFIQKSLGETLNLNTSDNCFYIYKDHKNGLEYIQRGRQIAQEGLYSELYGYHYNVFIDFREIFDTDGSWAKLENRLNGSGVPDIQLLYREQQLAPILEPFKNLVKVETLLKLTDESSEDVEETWKEFKNNLHNLCISLKAKGLDCSDENIIFDSIVSNINYLKSIKSHIEESKLDNSEYILKLFSEIKDSTIPLKYILSAGIVVNHLGGIFKDEDSDISSWMDEWLLTLTLENALKESGLDEWHSHINSILIKILIYCKDIYDLQLSGEESPTMDFNPLIKNMINNSTVREYLFVNYHNNVLWFNKEQFEFLIYCLFIFSIIIENVNKIDQKLHEKYALLNKILTAADITSYEVEKFMDFLF